VAVLVAAAAVWLGGAGWPDLVIGALLALLLLRSASRVFRASVAAVRASPQPS
jgi:Co/Zn/Cd efflux system component